MENKICNKCKIFKSVDFFSRKKSGLQDRCKDCFNLYTREHYSNNKIYYKEKARTEGIEHRSKIRKIINDFKSFPCKDCNKQYPPYIMDFDHVTGKKIAAISGMIRYKKDRILKEIEKCEVVCANCHRERTHKRKISP